MTSHSTGAVIAAAGALLLVPTEMGETGRPQ